MPLFTQEIPEGLRFETEQDALNYFKETLLEETPLGELYDKLHNEDWGKFNVQVTGDKKNLFVLLEHAEFDKDVVQVINLNQVSQEEIDFEDTKSRLLSLSKTSNVLRTVVEKKLSEMYTRINNKEEGLILDRLDLSNTILHITLEASSTNMTSGQIVIKEKTEKPNGVIANFELTIDEKVNTTHIENMIESMFLSNMSGKAHVENGLLQAGDNYLDYLLDYALVNGKELEINIK